MKGDLLGSAGAQTSAGTWLEGCELPRHNYTHPSKSSFSSNICSTPTETLALNWELQTFLGWERL